MTPTRRPIPNPVLPLLALAAALPAAAADPCLVGRWEPVGNAAGEWMQRNAPGLQVQAAQQGTLEFLADGTYVAGGSGQAQVAATQAQAEVRDLRFQARGTWSTEGATLVLQPTAGSMDGTMRIQGPAGRTIEVPMPRGAAQPQRLQYACSSDGLQTRMAVRNATPVVQRYRRLP
jgi:hypothetical protein